MEAKFIIRTPKGQAEGVEQKLKALILGAFVKTKESYVSPENDSVVWVIEGDLRRIWRVRNNVARFDALMQSILGNRMTRKLINKAISKEQQAELDDMLLHHTSIEIISDATPDETQEGQTYPSLWQRIKAKFTKRTIEPPMEKGLDTQQLLQKAQQGRMK